MAGLPPGDRGRRTPRPARWTRSTVPTTSSRCSSGCATPCPAGCRWSASTSATPTSCRSTTSPRRWTTSPTSPASTARRSTWSTPSRRTPSTWSTPSRPPRRRRSSPCPVDRSVTGLVPTGLLPRALRPATLLGAALRGRRRCTSRSSQTIGRLGIPPEVLEHVSFPSVYASRSTEKALAGSGISVPDLESYATTLWSLLGGDARRLDQERLRDGQGADRQDRRDHRRLLGHRPGHRRPGRQGRRASRSWSPAAPTSSRRPSG